MITTVCAAAAVLVLCGQIRRYLEGRKHLLKSLWGGRIQLGVLYNRGAGFALPGLRGKGLLAASGAALLALAAYVLRGCGSLGVGLMLGGGLSNLWERIRRGQVFDYLKFPKAPGFLKRYVYNAADLAIFLGALMMLLRRRKS